MYKLRKWELAKNLKKELYRKSIHLSSLWIARFIYVVHPGVSIGFFALLFVGNVLID